MIWAILAALSVALLLCIWRLMLHRREALRLLDQIQRFLNGDIPAPAFSVKDDRFAMFENAVIELESRLLLSQETARMTARHSQSFVQDVSHQFKTPIAGLRLFTEVDASAHQQQKLLLIERMEALISSLLKLEKLRSDGYALDYAPCELRELALDARALFVPLFPDKRIEVAGEASLRCDAYWVLEALQNLIKNACEHTAPGGRIDVTIDQSDREATIVLSDDGGGVPKEALPGLFERFFRIGQADNGKGVGLGLAIAKTIVLKHHGQIHAENGEAGLVIRIHLPKLNALTSKV